MSPAFYYHVKMNPGIRLDIPTDSTHNAFIYLISGSAELEGHREVVANQLALYDRGTSDLNIFSEGGAEFLVLGGEPLNETVFSYGPFVMNNEHQIRQCIMDYQLGKMGDPDVVNR
jgi:redox-sensitive bicupin YhaK (pirin superfamily)